MVHVWFNLVMFHAGHVLWLASYETYEECYAVQVQYEEVNPGDKFACPFAMQEET